MSVKRYSYPAPDPAAHSRRWLPRLFLEGDGLRTLDLGCGNGYYTIAAAKRGGHALGVSFDERALQGAIEMRDFMGLSAAQVEFEYADLRTYELPTEPVYDQIIAFEVVEHLLHPEDLLRRAHRALKADGLLYISVPNRNHGIREHTPHISRREQGWHVWHGYTFEQLERMLVSCGYDPADRRGLGWLGTQAMDWFIRTLGRSTHAQLVLSIVLYPIWRPLALLLDLLPTAEPRLLLVVARKRAAVADEPQPHGTEGQLT
jgi:SAM-dependent methyltransferase